MSLQTAITSHSFSHLAPDAVSVTIGDEAPITVDASAAYANGRLDWTTFRAATLATQNAALAAVQRPPIDGTGIGLPDEIPDWYQPIAAYGLDGRPNAWRIGALCRHNSIVWESITDWNVWEPGVTGYWRDVSSPIPAFIAAPPGYNIGDHVTKGTRVDLTGATVPRVFVSRRAANVFDPETDNSGWFEIADTILPYRWIGAEGYPLGARCTAGGNVWRATSEGAGSGSFPPNVVGTGWLDEGPMP